MNKTTMSVGEFGNALLDTLDLDPVYVLLYGAGLEDTLLRRWLLAYWCFYHVGTASWLADSKDYWGAFLDAAGTKEFPRCHERRHYRGAQALKSVTFLKERGLTKLFNDLLGNNESAPVAEVMRRAQQWVGFGPWIAFKVADMLERLGLLEVVFDAGAMFLFDAPRQGALLLYQETLGGIPPANVNEWAVNHVLAALAERPAPPAHDRPVNVQEAETVLCKWKSHRGGHYTVGEDVAACKKGLSEFTKSSTARRLYHVGKERGLW